jgi:hypothetical protein
LAAEDATEGPFDPDVYLAASVTDRVRRELELLLAESQSSVAFMEMIRCFQEEKSLPLMKRWGEAWSSRDKVCQEIRSAIAAGAGSPAINELPELCGALQHPWHLQGQAFDEFWSAALAGNVSLMVRWLDEWKTRTSHVEEIVQRWLDDPTNNAA